jgi:hypothetical protein
MCASTLSSVRPGDRDQRVDGVRRQVGEQHSVAGGGYRPGRVHVHQRQLHRRARRHGVHLRSQPAQRTQQVVQLDRLPQVRHLDDGEGAAAQRFRQLWQRRQPHQLDIRGQLLRRAIDQPAVGGQHILRSLDWEE